MPHWLQAIASFNPLTYEVDALRALMLRDGVSLYGLPADAAVLAGIFAVLVLVAARLYPRMVT
jgi:ABC-2 type transport system permease protein